MVQCWSSLSYYNTNILITQKQSLILFIEFALIVMANYKINDIFLFDININFRTILLGTLNAKTSVYL